MKKKTWKLYSRISGKVENRIFNVTRDLSIHAHWPEAHQYIV